MEFKIIFSGFLYQYHLLSATNASIIKTDIGIYIFLNFCINIIYYSSTSTSIQVLVNDGSENGMLMAQMNWNNRIINTHLG